MKKQKPGWGKVGGFCGLIVGVMAVPLTPGLSAAAKIAVISAAPVVGMIGISAAIGAMIGTSVSSTKPSAVQGGGAVANRPGS